MVEMHVAKMKWLFAWRETGDEKSNGAESDVVATSINDGKTVPEIIARLERRDIFLALLI